MSGLSMMLNSGKNVKWKYYAAAWLREHVPAAYYRRQLDGLLREIDGRSDAAEIYRRAEYYCRCDSTGDTAQSDALPADMQAATVGTLAKTGQSVYYHDTVEYARYFDPGLNINLLPGDVTFEPPVPSIVKSRPIGGDNANSVLLKLDKVRHFISVNDRVCFEDKRKDVLFRGKVFGSPEGKRNRIEFMEKFYGRDGVDAGAVDRAKYLVSHPEWRREKLTLWEQLDHAAIMALEGNDVASNLKWIMSSNSLAFSPRLHYETWFMEGTLVGGRHFVEVADDYSDLMDKADYYFSHPREAKEITAEANRYAAQFTDRHREKLVSLLTLRRYFDAVNG